LGQLEALTLKHGVLFNTHGLRYDGALCGIDHTSIQDRTDSMGWIHLYVQPDVDSAWCTNGTDTLRVGLTLDSIVDRSQPQAFLSAPLETVPGPFANLSPDTIVFYPESLYASGSAPYVREVLFLLPAVTENSRLPVRGVIISKEPATGVDVEIRVEGSDSTYLFPAGLWGGNLAISDVDGDGTIALIATSTGAFSIGFDWIP